jgi:hypothetical protein
MTPKKIAKPKNTKVTSCEDGIVVLCMAALE